MEKLPSRGFSSTAKFVILVTGMSGRGKSDDDGDPILSLRHTEVPLRDCGEDIAESRSI